MIYKDSGKTLYSSSGYSDKMGVAPLPQRRAGAVSVSQLAAHPAVAGFAAQSLYTQLQKSRIKKRVAYLLNVRK